MPLINQVYDAYKTHIGYEAKGVTYIARNKFPVTMDWLNEYLMAWDKSKPINLVYDLDCAEQGVLREIDAIEQRVVSTDNVFNEGRHTPIFSAIYLRTGKTIGYRVNNRLFLSETIRNMLTEQHQSKVVGTLYTRYYLTHCKNLRFCKVRATKYIGTFTRLDNIYDKCGL